MGVHFRSGRATGRPVGGCVASAGPLCDPAELSADHRRRNCDELPQLRGSDAPGDALRQHVRLPVCSCRRRPRSHVLRTLSYLVRVGPGQSPLSFHRSCMHASGARFSKNRKIVVTQLRRIYDRKYANFRKLL